MMIALDVAAEIHTFFALRPMRPNYLKSQATFKGIY